MARFVLLVGLLAGCSFSPDLGDGQVACGPAGECPPDYVCGAGGHCWRPGDGGCVPLTCAQVMTQGNKCTTLPDGCGGQLTCGKCGGGGD